MTISLNSENINTILNFINIFGIFIVAVIGYKYQHYLEKLKPLTAEEILKRENFINNKLKIYYEAINLLARHGAASRSEVLDAAGIRVPDIKDDPTEAEINKTCMKLALFTGNWKIIEKFQEYWVPIPPPNLYGEILEMIRKDLGYEDIDSKKFDYLFVVMPKSGVQL